MNSDLWGIGWGMFGCACVLAWAWVRVKGGAKLVVKYRVGDDEVEVAADTIENLEAANKVATKTNHEAEKP
jgi:hypothetical protein